MNISFFIAKKLYFNHQSDRRISKLAIQIATVGVTIGLAIMILSICILLGFKNELSNKIVGFGSHIQILNTNASTSPESFSIVTDAKFRKKITQAGNVKHVQRFSNKLGIIKNDEDFKGIMLKGIAEEYDANFLRSHLIKGQIPTFSKTKHKNDIVISQLIANEMKLKVGDRLYAYFFEKSIRTRLFHIVGIYQTNMNQFDESMIIANLYAVNQLNGWHDDQSSGLEVFANNFSQIKLAYNNILKITRDAIDHYGNTYSTFTIQELYSQIFDWLKLLDLNVWVILGLMVCVACFTMISGLLILILERTNTIGILKAVGSTNGLIRKIFVNYSSFIMIRGIVFGNLIGLGLAFLQYKFQLIGLDASKYYVDHVPILFEPEILILLNIATIIVCIFAMIGPSYLVSKISPVKAIRFD
jgi:lipoprotein-releasing system permease protein